MDVVPEGKRIETAVAKRTKRRRLAGASVTGPGVVVEEQAAAVLETETDTKHYFCMCDVGYVFNPANENTCIRLATWSATSLYYYDAPENVGDGASAVIATLPTARGR
jgi:hypothetical protein